MKEAVMKEAVVIYTMNDELSAEELCCREAAAHPITNKANEMLRRDYLYSKAIIDWDLAGRFLDECKDILADVRSQRTVRMAVERIAAKMAAAGLDEWGTDYYNPRRAFRFAEMSAEERKELAKQASRQAVYVLIGLNSLCRDLYGKAFLKVFVHKEDPVQVQDVLQAWEFFAYRRYREEFQVKAM